jgi:hypothetical protein
MTTQESPKLFGKIGIADFFVIAVGAGVCSNFAMLLTRNPQTTVYLGYGAMLAGAFITRYALVVITRYIHTHFDNTQRKELLIKIAYFICFVILIFAFTASRAALEQHVRGDNKNSVKNEGSIEEMLPKFASQLNAKLPIMVDSDTRLDSSMGINKTFRYNYTLVNYSSSDVTAQGIQNAFKQQIETKVCTSQETLAFLKNDVTVSYAYFSNEGEQITVISVTPSQCGIN